jgi:catechol 2,3-dioxygenase-like lactoylglutathione lyase family enzyme
VTVQRLEHAGIVVDDLAAATAFFIELGLKLQGEMPATWRMTRGFAGAFRSPPRT